MSIHNYEYSDADVKKIIKALNDEVKEVEVNSVLIVPKEKSVNFKMRMKT